MLTAKMTENQEKFEKLEVENVVVRAKNIEILVRVKTFTIVSTPPTVTHSLNSKFLSPSAQHCLVN